jgi:predicted aldo/keto reductase-like oxidoreductase
MRAPKDPAQFTALLEQAVGAGVNFIDTAYAYSGNEVMLGQALKDTGLRDKVYIQTKCPIQFVKSGTDFEKFFSRELERLQTDRVEYYLLHMLTDAQTLQRFLSWGLDAWVQEKKAKGQIGSFGFSFHGRGADFLAILDTYPFDSCLIQYNYADPNYQAGVTGLKAAAAKGMPVMIMEPLLGGRLVNSLPPEAGQILAAAGKTPADFGLRWLWNQPEVTVVLSGMGAPEQMTANFQTADTAAVGALAETDMELYAAVRSVFAASNKIPCQGCGYCLPCPKGVNIPGCFAAYNTCYAISKKLGRHQYMTSTGSFSEKRGNAGQCAACHACEKKCPQMIPIADKLKEVGKEMEPWYWRIGMGAARVFVRFGLHK